MEREVDVARPMVKFTDEGVSITDQSCLVRSEKVNDKTAARRLRKKCRRGSVRPDSLHSQGLGY